MNFKLVHPLPERCIVAVSGGMDSMSALHFLKQRTGRVSHVLHVHHNTGDFADSAQKLVRSYCESSDIDLSIYRVTEEVAIGDSRENHWREQRLRFFRDEHNVHNLPIVLAHNMDDCFEEYIICTMLRGYSGTIPYQNGPCIRPFRTWTRQDIRGYASRFKVPSIEDPANKEYTKYLRAKVRMHVAPKIRNLNPGIYKIVEKVIREQDIRDNESV